MPRESACEGFPPPPPFPGDWLPPSLCICAFVCTESWLRRGLRRLQGSQLLRVDLYL